jgi:CRISPR-associated endonuclease/helicase Cas3
MTPIHRSSVIRKIKESLRLGEKITVVSTSLVEAGVDFDFETVFRENAGLDNVIQSGGRCNREGRKRIGNVYVFETDLGSGEIQIKANITRSLFNEFENIASDECIREYYRRLMAVNDKLIEKNTITSTMGNSFRFEEIQFREYAEKFKFIDNSTVGLVIPDDENATLLENLRFGGYCAKRKLQKYCVSLKIYELEDMIKSGLAEEINGVYVLVNKDYYNEEYGLDPKAEINYIL